MWSRNFSISNFIAYLLRWRDDVLVVSDRYYEFRYGRFKAPERSKLAVSNGIEIDQTGKLCLVSSWLVATFHDFVEPTLRIARALF